MIGMFGVSVGSVWLFFIITYYIVIHLQILMFNPLTAGAKYIRFVIIYKVPCLNNHVKDKM